MVLDSPEGQVVLKTDHIRGLLTILQTIKPSQKQNCSVGAASDGLSVRLEDNSKTLQSSVFLRADLFAGFQCPLGRKQFGMQFNLLVDTLSVFASTEGQQLVMRYPGSNSDLLLEMSEEGGDTSVCTYARIDTEEMDIPPNLADLWEGPTSSFIMPGAFLKEAIEDLEWPGAPVRVQLCRDPQRIVFSARREGELEVEFPTDRLSDFTCSSPQVEHEYKYKHLRAAFSNLPYQKEAAGVSTKVTIDSQGLMRVVHLMNMQGHAADIQSLTQDASQRGTARGTTASIQFLIVPEDVEVMD